MQSVLLRIARLSALSAALLILSSGLVRAGSLVNVTGADSVPAESVSESGTVYGYTVVYCSCNGYLTNEFIEIFHGDSIPASAVITSVEVRGDTYYSAEQILFRLGSDGYRYYNGYSNRTTYRSYSYYSYYTQPTLIKKDGVWGFYADFFIESGVNTDWGLDPPGWFNFKINYTVSDQHELQLGQSKAAENLSIGQQQVFKISSSGDVAAAVEIGLSGGSGEADLFVGDGFEPTPYENYSCKSTNDGTSQQCIIEDVSNTVYATVYALTAVSNATISASDPNALAIGETKDVRPLSAGSQRTFVIDAGYSYKYEDLGISLSGGSGDVDLFVGDGFKPTPYQNFTCDSQNDGNSELCVMPNPNGVYYATVYAFEAANNVQISATGYGPPDAPVMTSAEPWDVGTWLHFDAPAANGARITSYNGACTLVTDFEFDDGGGNSTGTSGDGGRALSDNSPARLAPVDAELVPAEIDLPEDALPVRLSEGVTARLLPERLVVSAFDGEEIELLIEASRQTPSGNRYMTGSTADGYPFRLLISAEGVLVGRIETGSEVLRIDPTEKLGLSAMRSLSRAGLEPVGFEGDERVVEGFPAAEGETLEEVPVSEADTTVIDVMFLYNSGLPSPTATIDYLLQYMNDIHRNSGTEATFVMTSMRPYNSSSSLPLEEIQASSTVTRWREEDRADLVAYLGPYRGGGYCGVAYVPGANGGSYSGAVKQLGFSASLVGSYGSGYCTDETFAHEIGHNLGATHDRANTSTNPYYFYAYGDGVSGIFGTVMSYLSPEVGLFSNPSRSCNGRACGQSNYTDVARAIRNVKTTVSNIFTGSSGTNLITVDPAAGIFGSVSPSTSTTLLEGAKRAFTFTPDLGYKVDKVSGTCSGTLSGNVYTVTAGNKDCSFEGTFTPDGKYYTINAYRDRSVAIDPPTPLKIRPFDTVRFTVSLASDYSILSLDSSCPGSYQGQGRYQTGQINGNCTLTISAALTGATGSGSKSPVLVQGLSAGEEYECSMTATNKYGPSATSNALTVIPFLATQPGTPRITRIEEEDGELWVYFQAGSTGNLPVTYTAQCGEQSASGNGSPLKVKGLQNGVPVSCGVTATNDRGSRSSGAVTATPEEFTSGGLPIWLLYEAAGKSKQ